VSEFETIVVEILKEESNEVRLCSRRQIILILEFLLRFERTKKNGKNKKKESCVCVCSRLFLNIFAWGVFNSMDYEME
jgi:hypothetical protein